MLSASCFSIFLRLKAHGLRQGDVKRRRTEGKHIANHDSSSESFTTDETVISSFARLIHPVETRGLDNPPGAALPPSPFFADGVDAKRGCSTSAIEYSTEWIHSRHVLEAAFCILAERKWNTFARTVTTAR